jgi:hypothetical protein
MIAIAWTVFAILAAIAALHAAWAFRVRWPARDERSLTALVVGQTGLTRMPSRIACLVASAAILIAGLVALALAWPIDIHVAAAAITAIGFLVTGVFAMRGAAAYMPTWRRRFSQEPFATLDQRCYAPLCLLLAAAFAMLTLRRMVS